MPCVKASQSQRPARQVGRDDHRALSGRGSTPEQFDEHELGFRGGITKRVEGRRGGLRVSAGLAVILATASSLDGAGHAQRPAHTQRPAMPRRSW